MSRVAVVGNLSLDVVDGSPPRPGGCPCFAADTLPALTAEVEILARCADGHRSLFEERLRAGAGSVTILPATRTTRFEIAYEGEDRRMRVTAIGDSWTAADAAHLGADVSTVHVAPLLRSDFPAAALAALADGRRLSLDAQGLVRAPRLGPLVQDASFDRSTLDCVSVLKLSEEEARIVARGRFDALTARELAVPEVLVTLGSRGSDVWVDGAMTHVAVTPVHGVETTGAGDAFMVGYVSARDDGASPVDAARAGSELVTALLTERRGGS